MLVAFFRYACKTVLHKSIHYAFKIERNNIWKINYRVKHFTNEMKAELTKAKKQHLSKTKKYCPGDLKTKEAIKKVKEQNEKAKSSLCNNGLHYKQQTIANSMLDD